MTRVSCKWCGQMGGGAENMPDHERTCLTGRIAKLEAVRDAAERTDAYLRVGGMSYCDVCLTPDELHEDDCPVPALRAALDDAKGAP